MEKEQYNLVFKGLAPTLSEARKISSFDLMD